MGTRPTVLCWFGIQGLVEVAPAPESLAWKLRQRAAEETSLGLDAAVTPWRGRPPCCGRFCSVTRAINVEPIPKMHVCPPEKNRNNKVIRVEQRNYSSQQ